MKKIEVPDGVKKKLEREFSSDYTTVNNALRLITKTKKADNIRKRAFELGGKLVEVAQAEIDK